MSCDCTYTAFTPGNATSFDFSSWSLFILTFVACVREMISANNAIFNTTIYKKGELKEFDWSCIQIQKKSVKWNSIKITKHVAQNRIGFMFPNMKEWYHFFFEIQNCDLWAMLLRIHIIIGQYIPTPHIATPVHCKENRIEMEISFQQN